MAERQDEYYALKRECFSTQSSLPYYPSWESYVMQYTWRLLHKRCASQYDYRLLLQSKIHLVNAIVLPVVMDRCESWTIEKAEGRRTDAFELWCWRRLLRVPQTAKRSTQSILKEINSEYSSEGLMLKLKLQYFGHLMRSANSLEKTQMLGKIKGKK